MFYLIGGIIAAILYTIYFKQFYKENKFEFNNDDIDLLLIGTILSFIFSWFAVIILSINLFIKSNKNKIKNFFEN